VQKRKAAAVAATLLHLRKSGKKRYCKKKYWIAPIFQERKVHGFFHAVLPKLVLEDLRFNNYIRMSATQFENSRLLRVHRGAAPMVLEVRSLHHCSEQRMIT
ncbi:hypothetical protein X777_15962, partial [Ooceraea biroi]